MEAGAGHDCKKPFQQIAYSANSNFCKFCFGICKMLLTLLTVNAWERRRLHVPQAWETLSLLPSVDATVCSFERVLPNFCWFSNYIQISFDLTIFNNKVPEDFCNFGISWRLLKPRYAITIDFCPHHFLFCFQLFHQCLVVDSWK